MWAQQWRALRGLTEGSGALIFIYIKTLWLVMLLCDVRGKECKTSQGLAGHMMLKHGSLIEKVPATKRKEIRHSVSSQIEPAVITKLRNEIEGLRGEFEERKKREDQHHSASSQTEHAEITRILNMMEELRGETDELQDEIEALKQKGDIPSDNIDLIWYV